MTKEGDKAAKKGVAQYCKGKEGTLQGLERLSQRWRDADKYHGGLGFVFLGTLLFQLVLEGEDDDPGNDGDEYGHDAGEEGSLELKSSDAVLQNVYF